MEWINVNYVDAIKDNPKKLNIFTYYTSRLDGNSW